MKNVNENKGVKIFNLLGICVHEKKETVHGGAEISLNSKPSTTAQS